jgi:hypothetical protein
MDGKILNASTQPKIFSVHFSNSAYIFGYGKMTDVDTLILYAKMTTARTALTFYDTGYSYFVLEAFWFAHIIFSLYSSTLHISSSVHIAHITC